jgi:transposase InsO family protein
VAVPVPANKSLISRAPSPKLAIFDYLEVLYNRQRRHISIGGIPPVTFDTRHAKSLGRAA